MPKHCILILMLALTGASCTFTRKVQTGMQAYEVKQFSVATSLFAKEYEASRSQQDKATIAYYTGASYMEMNNPAAAEGWYFKAHQDGYGPESMMGYAEALKQQEKYKEAIQAYQNLLKSSPDNAQYRSNITLCRQAIDWSINKNPAYQISQAPFNSSASDYSPAPIGPGQVVFTSDRNAGEDKSTYLWTGRAFSDLFVSKAGGLDIAPFDPAINSESNDGTVAFSPDGNTLVFTRCFAGSEYNAWCKLMISQKRGNEWTEPEVMPFVIEKSNYGQPAFAANGSTLFFTSDLPDGEGGHDLYFSQSDGAGGWTQPVNVGPIINTMGNEEYPTVYKDTLYFSSDRLPGLGGLDIFKTYLDNRGQWVPPINLRSPINSGSDDFGFVVDTFTPAPEGIVMQGYFTTSRGGASRNDDIYAFSVKGKPTSTTSADSIPPVVEEKKIEYQLYLSLRVMEPIFEVPDDPNSKRIGKKPLPNGPIIISDGLTDQRFVTDELGQFLIKLDFGKKYTFTAKYRDHLAVTYELNTDEVEKNPEKPIRTITQILELDPIFKNKEIILENIFYDYDQWAIRDDAKPSLDKLAIIMKNNPALRIQLSSHTDCRGTDEYNLDLSQKRAQAAVDYLKSVGIPEKRLVAQGFGESNPAVNCVCEQCTEAQHQANRRTTFKVID